MRRTRGPRPYRGPHCCCGSTGRLFVRWTLTAKLHGRVRAIPHAAHGHQSLSSLGLQVSVQYLPPRPPEIQHALPSHCHASSSDVVELPTLQAQERPGVGDGTECSSDSTPSTSCSSRMGDGIRHDSRRRSARITNSRDAAALTRYITRTQSTLELQSVLQQYRSQFNAIHISAAIVKLAKLAAVESGRQRLRYGLSSLQGEHQWRGLPKVHPVATAEYAGALKQGPSHVRNAGVAAPLHLGSAADSLASGMASAAVIDRREPAPEQVGGPNETQLNISSNSNARMSSESCSSRCSTDNSFDGLSNEHRRTSRVAEGSSEQSATADPGIPLAIICTTTPKNFNPDRGPLHPTMDRGSSCEAAAAAQPSPFAPLLSDLVSCFLAQLPHYTARQFANVVWALGSMGARSHPELLEAAATHLQAHGAEKLLAAQPQELSNLALGLAKLGYREVSLWAAIIVAGKARLHEFKPQELHNIAWAVAAASQDRSMISAVVQAALPQLGRFNASGLSNLLWACATAQCPCEELFDGAAAALIALSPQELNYQDVSNTAWACAKLQYNHPQFMTHLARLVLGAAAVPCGLGMQAASTQELVNTLWAFASLPLPPSMPLAMESSALVHGREGDRDSGTEAEVNRALDFSGSNREASRSAAGQQQEAQDHGWRLHWLTPLSRVPSSSADLRTASQPPFSADVQSKINSHGDLNTTTSQAPASSSSGVGSGGYGLRETVVRLLVTEVSRRSDLSPQGASNALWACARLQPCPLPLSGLAALLHAAVRHCTSMRDQELANVLWALGELRNAGLYVPYGALESVFGAACCPSRLDSMAPAGLAQLLHSAVALRRVPTGHMDVIAQHVLRRLPELGPQELCVVAMAVSEAVRIGRYCNPLLLNGLANAAVAIVGELCSQGISTLLWAFARANHYHGPLTTALCRAAKPRLRQFSDMELSNLVYALAILKGQDRALLVLAARVLVERVRQRRQRGSAKATAAVLRPQRTTEQLERGVTSRPQAVEEEQPQHLRQQFIPVLEHALGGTRTAEEIGHQQRAQQAEGDDMAVALASHRQQQRRRRIRQQQQQSLEGEPQLAQVVLEGSLPSKATAMDSDVGLVGNGSWLRAKSDTQQVRQQQVPEPQCTGADTATAVSEVAASIGDRSSGASSSSSSSLPALDTTPAGSLQMQPEARLRLHSLPVLHQHDDVDLTLQPRRPPPREACSGDGRRCKDPADADPADRRTSASTGILPQRDALSIDSADCSNGLRPGPTPRDHAKSMAKLLWSYAKCNLYNQTLFWMLVQELQPVLRHATPHELTLALWAVACHDHRCPEFMDTAAVLLLRGRLQQLCGWDGSVVAWAFGKLGYQHRELFEALQRHARVAGGGYAEPCLLRLAWACVAVEVPLQEDLMRRIVDLKQRARRVVAHSSYDGTDGEARPPVAPRKLM